MSVALQDNEDEISILWNVLPPASLVIRHQDGFAGRVSKKRPLKYKQLLS